MWIFSGESTGMSRSTFVWSWAAALYGLLGAFAMFVAFRLLPQPAGSVAFWVLLAIQLSVGAVVTWRRTGLPLAAAAMALAGLESVVIAFLSHRYAGYVLEEAPVLEGRVLVPVLVAALLPGGIMLLESYLHPDRWAAWKRHLQGCSLWDFLTLEHIPRLR